VLGVRSKEGEERRSESKENVSSTSLRINHAEERIVVDDLQWATLETCRAICAGWLNLDLDLSNKEYLIKSERALNSLTFTKQYKYNEQGFVHWTYWKRSALGTHEKRIP